MLEKSDEYRRRADDVLKSLQAETDPAVRLAYVNIAESWLRLAQAAVEAGAAEGGRRPEQP